MMSADLSKAVVMLMLIWCSLLFNRSSGFVLRFLYCCAVFSVHSKSVIILLGQTERAGCFTLIVFIMSCRLAPVLKTI